MSLQNRPAQNIHQYLEDQAGLDTLRFITCGSVDDGKSTLIGRLLFEAQLIFDDQITTLQHDSEKTGTQGNDIDFALLVDGLASEREQGITIDVAYRFFATDKRKFIVADTPGHEQYTRNMVTGASTAQLAIIIIDARHGILEQTRRHSIICSTLGIRNVIVAINKMDLVDYSQDVYDQILEEYNAFAALLNFSSITAIPISALKGDNIIKPSTNTSWYKGGSLLSYLETIEASPENMSAPLRFPVQWVNRPNQNFRGFSGTVEAGLVSIGQKVKILPSNQEASVDDIILYEDHLKSAEKGQAVTITLDREVDVSRGDVIVAAGMPCEVSDQFEVNLVWMHQDPGFVGRSFYLKLGTTLVNAHITTIKHKININNLDTLSASQLEMNDLCVVTIKTDKNIAFEAYQDCPAMGSFILIDRFNNQTVAAGMILFALRRAKNIHQHKLDVDKASRNQLNGHKSKVIWFTGLSGSGKSTIANALEKTLHARGILTYILDGDNIRHGLNSDLGFTDADRIQNIRRIGEVAKLMADAGLVVLTAFISPFRSEREMVRNLFEDGEFIEVFVSTSLEVAEQRDPKGLYQKARRGEIPNFTGISSPYEEPENPEIVVNTEDNTVDEIVEKLSQQIDL